MANVYSQYTYDNNMLLKSAGLIGSTATETTILDLGSGLFEGYLVLDVSAVEVASTDEKYTVHLEGSNSSTCASGSVTLCNIPLGVKTDPADQSTGTGRFVVPFRNEQNGTTYRYVRIYTLVAGSVATGINFTAWIAKD
jgi:hypothetical protein